MVTQSTETTQQKNRLIWIVLGGVLVMGCLCALCAIVFFIFNRPPSPPYYYTQRPYFTNAPKYTPTPAIRTYSIDIARKTTTDILLMPGDKVSVKATGQIYTGGLFWAYADPDGVDESEELILSSKSIDQNFRHASLLYSIDTAGSWYFCGSSCNFSVKPTGQGGYLEFNVNDTSQGDNTGKFKLTITVVSP
jgi:hypothetical protein